MIRLTLPAAILIALSTNTGAAEDLSSALKTIKAVAAEGAGNEQAQAAWKTLAKAEAAQIPVLLAALEDANPLAANYIRAAIDAVAERQLQSGKPLPADALEKFALDTKRNARARRLAYEWLTRVDKTAAERLVPKFADDPAVEFRRDAVAQLLDAAAKIDSSDKDTAIDAYRQALAAARDRDQVDKAAAALSKLGQTVDLPAHFGFIQHWKVIGPFDNHEERGYPIAYPPEKSIDFDASYDDKTEKVKWMDFATADNYGNVDLNKALGKTLGAVGYAAVEFESDRDRDVELRLGTRCAWKMFVNGQLAGAYDSYNPSTLLDQHIVKAKLKKGNNVILVKCCQNEQTVPWAQLWHFQLRVCDVAGTAVLAANRPPRPAAEADAAAAAPRNSK
ncbi:MAG: hypothetical protein HYS13_25955 [Planctomycetia bacterium]|nr:hypothetical protein [Planctomycetia bacterium]